jgi:hypothetical protein
MYERAHLFCSFVPGSTGNDQKHPFHMTLSKKHSKSFFNQRNMFYFMLQNNRAQLMADSVYPLFTPHKIYFATRLAHDLVQHQKYLI